MGMPGSLPLTTSEEREAARALTPNQVRMLRVFERVGVPTWSDLGGLTDDNNRDLLALREQYDIWRPSPPSAKTALTKFGQGVLAHLIKMEENGGVDIEDTLFAGRLDRWLGGDV